MSINSKKVVFLYKLFLLARDNLKFYTLLKVVFFDNKKVTDLLKIKNCYLTFYRKSVIIMAQKAVSSAGAASTRLIVYKNNH